MLTMCKLQLLLTLGLLVQTFCAKFESNVCESYAAYGNIWMDKTCRYNPDVNSRTPHIILRHGYPLEVHQVVTDDGYILQMFRIPHNNKDVEDKRQPVFIQHGANTDSAVWVDIGNRSLAFQLVERGFDVWLGNIRGNTYSQGHILYNKDHTKFWDFSFHEMAMYDIPRQLDEVATVTGQRGKIIYIGHSMGTTMSYVYSIRRKEHAEKTLKGIISLAPVAYLRHLQNLEAIAVPNNFMLRVIFKQMRKLGLVSITDNEENAYNAMSKACLKRPFHSQTCIFFISIGFGFKSKQLLPEDFPLLISYISSGMSTKTLQHFVQNAVGDFREFDYGPINNKKVYGTPTAPVYNLSAITIPIHLYYGKDDGLAGEKDVKKLYNELKTRKSITPVAQDNSVKFNHFDFMYAKDIENLLYEPMFERIMSEFKEN